MKIVNKNGLWSSQLLVSTIKEKFVKDDMYGYTLEPLTSVCETCECQHKKCDCGHCDHYHIGGKLLCVRDGCDCELLDNGTTFVSANKKQQNSPVPKPYTPYEVDGIGKVYIGVTKTVAD